MIFTHPRESILVGAVEACTNSETLHVVWKNKNKPGGADDVKELTVT